MSENKTLRSFADLKTNFTLPAPQWVEWTPSEMTGAILASVTETLSTWLDARMLDLVREKVNLEDVSVVHRGGRTVIRVHGRDRFEFKLKITMGGA